ncbi:GIY-YIG nuclease family protein [Candidatus Kaiserbacteria bacterium]|nr:GIY-YIG nuclease family protein [Candidatus Kaiserbacteria bacterium]
MYFLYILRSRVRNRHYIGISDDPTRRLSQHNAGAVRSTKSYRPWVLLYKEPHNDKTSARKRELFLKKTTRARTELFSKLDTGPIV